MFTKHELSRNIRAFVFFVSTSIPGRSLCAFKFAVHPGTGRLVVIEMNPRVSRSSALASKAIGFPIARIAAKLVLGYRLDEIDNAITRKTPACFEPALDYIVVKIPRWAFEKFPTVDQTLGSQMKSVGEAMAIGRTFPEALQKALRSLEQGRYGLGADGKDVIASDHVEPHLLGEWRKMVMSKLAKPCAEHVFYLRHALKLGVDVEEVARVTGVDPWFLDQIAAIVEMEQRLRAAAPRSDVDMTTLRKAITPPKDEGYDSVMVNCNPETVSTDYDISSRLYFEPITLEDVREICEVEKPDGVIVQFGEQTPLKIAQELQNQGVKVLGTSPAKIAAAEDRELFGDILRSLKIPHPSFGIAKDYTEVAYTAEEVGYPVLVRPSFLLGRRAMEIVYDLEGLHCYLHESASEVTPEHPVLIDRYIEDAFEFDVDAVSDGEKTLICGIMQHIEQAGVHSGGSLFQSVVRLRNIPAGSRQGRGHPFRA